MNNLFSAHFFRLRKSRVFWLGVLFLFLLGILAVCGRYSATLRYQEQALFDDTLFIYPVFIGCCSAVFCSLFTGTEYSDGTIRNKLIAGHSRPSIYLASWLTSFLAAILMALAFLCSYCPLGALLLGAPQASPATLLSSFLVSIFTILAYTSIFHLLSVLLTKRSASAVTCLLVFFGMLILALTIQAKLNAPEFIPEYSVTVGGIVTQETMTLNPKYLQPDARKIYQFFFDVLPAGQSVQLLKLEAAHPLLLAVYSAALSAITTAAGVVAFQKKNLN